LTPQAAGSADLTTCDREPIHIPGSIQPHGVLLALEPERLTVVQAAGATARAFGRAVEAVLGSGVRELIGVVGEAGLRAWMATPPAEDRATEVHVHADRTGADMVVLAHRSGDLIVLELEAAGDGGVLGLSRVHAMIARMQRRGTLTEFCQGAADEIRDLTGFDHVMVYRFLEDDSGRVIAEARAEHVTPLFDLHFPASDIPKQARELYRRNWLRIICDSGYTPAPLVPPLTPSGAPLDMGKAALRSVSPVHVEYLRNMGVAASMSVSIVVGGRLWGLIACHHNTPRLAPHAVRLVCELFAQTFSLQLEAKVQGEDYEYRLRLRNTHQQLLAQLFREGDLVEGLTRHRPNLLDFLDSDGVALWLDGHFTSLGKTPDATQVTELAYWLRDTQPAGVFATDRLGELLPSAQTFADVGSGVLALSVTRTPRDYVMWFRPELVETVTWAGDPNKPVEGGEHGERISPRKSFAAWRELMRGRSRPWRPVETEAAESLRLALLEIVVQRMEEVAQERSEAKVRQDLLLAELNHRVKNTLATVQAVVRQSGGGQEDVSDYVRSLEERLRSMARAHDLLTQARWESADLRGLIQGELVPYVGSDGRVLVMQGPGLELKPKAALAMSLAVHELATNAAKYGSMSRPHGRIDVSWVIDGDRFELDWKERGGPPVEPPTRRGFGSTVIETSLGFEIDGESTLAFERDGLRCSIKAPAEEVSSREKARAPEQKAGPEEAERVNKAARRILVVEDSALLAMSVEAVVEDLGWTPVGPAARVPRAMQLLETEKIDGAVLDVDLAGTKSFPVAEALEAAGVPFLFTTGYDGAEMLPDKFKGAPVLSKPYAEAALRRMLLQAFGE
jgi:light-regulated signal transduction histidine kinase (bacteriophytochrome)/CheY-like chemotaxis protein